MNRTSFYDSPRRSPQLTQSIRSPAHSVHPDVVYSPNKQVEDYGHRTTDFFDMSDTEDDDSTDQAGSHRVEEGAEVAIEKPLRTVSKQRRSGNYLGGMPEQFKSQCEERHIPSSNAIEQYMRDNPPEAYGSQPGDDRSAGSSIVGSVEELMRSRHNHLSVAKGRLPRSTLQSSTGLDEDDESLILGKHSTKADNIVGALALTLQTLERLSNDDTKTTPQLSPRTPTSRTSRLLTKEARIARHRSASTPAKKVSMVPPPINTTPYHLPDDMVRTPYPFLQYKRKDFSNRSPATPSATTPFIPPAADSVMTITIARSNPNSSIRITTLLIPAPSDLRRTLRSGSTTAQEKHFATLDFDDMEFFQQLRHQYNHLLGPYRWISARSLSAITVSGTASQAADAGYGWLHGPRSPRFLAAKGLSDTFSEEKLLHHFRNPKKGKSRFAWVCWAHRLATAPVSSAPPSVAPQTPGLVGSPFSARTANRTSMIRRAEQHEGLEFVVSWSWKRILVALTAVILCSIAAALLWIFLGTHSRAAGEASGGGSGGGGLSGSGSEGAGFKDAGDRVGTGVVVGICVLLVGVAGMGGWIGVSWLVL